MTPELSAHHQRVEALISRMPANPQFREICASFDEAVEFAAWEGTTIAEAIGAFLEDTAPGMAELREIVAGGTLRLRAANKLPVMPKAASRLLRTSEAATSSAELQQIAASDQVLAARLLGAANSARYATRFEIVRVGEAVIRLGVPVARGVLLAACLEGLFGSRPLRDLWEHSRNVAEAACTLAAFCNVAPETAYAAGLLHDIGRLVFTSGPADLRIAEQSWLAAGFPLVYAETLVYRKDHAIQGAELLRAWDVPHEIVEAVEFHHRPEKTESTLPSLLCIAEKAAEKPAEKPNGNTADEPEDLWSEMRLMSACRKTGITLEQIASMAPAEPILEIACA